jgi:ligand-binding sensor domain-containing protein
VRDADIGALAHGADGVWSAGPGSTRAFALSFVHHDLQQFARRGHRGFANSAGMRVQQLVVRGLHAWLATDRGLWRLPLEGRDAPLSQWRVANGLPDEMVLAVLPRLEGAWVGTRRGLAFVPDAEPGTVGAAVQRVGFEGEAVRALAMVGDRLFVGTPSGLFVRAARAVTATAQRVPGVLARPVSALAWHDSVLLVVSERAAALYPLTDAGQREGFGTDALVGRELALAEIGVPLRAHLDARSLWIAGTAGVLVWQRDQHTDVPRLMRVGAELPAPVTDLVVGDTWAWVGTREGVVRVRLAAEGGLP